jgi:menaquinone-dependent protoporphyrinogen IX oxidase
MLRKGAKSLRKIFKIILAVFLAFFIFAVVGLSVVFLDVAAYTATSTQNLTPTGYATGVQSGKALVVYDPGLTGAARTIASKITIDLQAQGYFVDLAGIKSSTASTNASQYPVIVVGGPIYGGTAASSVQLFLSHLEPAQGAKIGVYGVGSFNTQNDKVAPLPNNSSFSIKETLKISTSQDATVESAQFVTGLLS